MSEYRDRAKKETVLTKGEFLEENAPVNSQEDIQVQKSQISNSVFADKEFPNDWHVETIDAKSGDIFVALFSGPDSEERAREYAKWQESKDVTAGFSSQRQVA